MGTGTARVVVANAVEPSSTGKRVGRLPTYKPHTIALTAIALIATLFAVRVAAAFFVPLLLSLFISYAMSPAVTWLERLKIPRPAGALVMVALLAVALSAAVYRAGSDATDLLAQLPSAAENLRLKLTASQRGGAGTLQNVQRTAAELEKLAGAAAQLAAPARSPAPTPPAIDMKSLLLIGTGNAVIAAGQLASVLFLTYFLLAAGDLFRRKLIEVFGGSFARRRITLEILDAVHRLNQRYFAVVLVVNLVVGVATGFAMYAIGLERAVAWGVAAAVLHTIPYLGVTLLAGGAALTAYLQLGTLQAAMLAAGAPLAVGAIVGIGLQTWLMGRAGRMNAPAVFVSLLFWGMLWGAWGLLLAFPIMVAVKTVCDRVDALKPVGILLGK